MSDAEKSVAPPPSLEDIQRGWNHLTLRVQESETNCRALELENKALRSLLEKAVEHRKKSHAELVNLITTLVTKLPLNDVGVIVSRLVEHSTEVSDVCVALIQGKNEENLLQPALLKALDKTKRDLNAAIKPLVDELIRLDAPFQPAMLQGLVADPESFFAPANVRASRAFVKGQVTREQILAEFGEEALPFFKDLTTDAIHNPLPKPEEILLGFKSDFDELLNQNPNALAAKRAELVALRKKVLQGRESRAQKVAFLKLSFVLQLLHYYDNQSTESPDVMFAQRLPPLIEQLVVTGENDPLDEKLIAQAEELLAFILNADYRRSVVNNFGKAGGKARTLRVVLTLRAGATFTEHDPVITDSVKHLLGLQKPPAVEPIATVLRLVNPEAQKAVVRGVYITDRLRREEAEALGRALLKQLGLPDFPVGRAEAGGASGAPQITTWDIIRELIASKANPVEITEAIRKQLHAKYDADEIKSSWLLLAESDSLVLVRVFCLLPYLPGGETDPIARIVLESYVNRLTHEKYAATYSKMIHALRNIFRVKPDSPALLNFLALVKWVDPGSAAKIARDIGMTPP